MNPLPALSALLLTIVTLGQTPLATAAPWERGYHPTPPRAHHRAPPARWYPAPVRGPNRHTSTAVVAGITYFILDGLFHQRGREGLVVVKAPIGARVARLPAGYRVVTIGPRSYYVVSDDWYRWERGGYVVVARPKEETRESGTVPIDETKLYVYPKGGQQEERIARDRYACHQWAVKESGVDPSLGERADDEHYRRAITACLEARDYTVK